MDRVNKIFAQLAKIHAAKYFLIGGGLTAFIYVFILKLQTNSTSFMWIGYAGFFSMVIDYYETRLFYEKYELGGKNLRITNTGMVLTDEYFYTKINSPIKPAKKLAGYLYVILRIWVTVVLGFALFTITLLGIKKGLGF